MSHCSEGTYLAYLKAGIKADTLAALRTAPLHISTLFLDTVIKQAEEDISNYDKGRSTRKVAITPMNVQRASRTLENRTGRLGRIFHGVTRGVRENTSTHRDLPRANSLINDNQCVTMLQERLLAGSPSVQRQTRNSLNVNCHAANLVHTAPRLSQKKEISPGLADCYLSESKLKYMLPVSLNCLV